jgi:hypothetical protein
MALGYPDQHYTYSDYLTWDDSARYELIDGIPYMMPPAPLLVHQKASAINLTDVFAFAE